MAENEALIRGDMDYISNLPREVLYGILKRIPSTRDVAVTCILSKRWRNVWTGMPILDFDDSSLKSSSTRDDRIIRELSFMNFVTRGLTISKFDLKKFRLRRVFAKLDDGFDLVKIWVCAAIKRNVQEMELDFLRDNKNVQVKDVRLPGMLFESNKLVVLKLQNDILLHIPDSVSLPNLRELYLEFIEYDEDESAPKLFAACPVLEKLVITRLHDNLLVMNVSVPSLRTLRIVFPSDPAKMDDLDAYVRVLEVDCPNLQDFHLQDLMTESFSFNILSSLSEAYIDVGDPNDVRTSFSTSTAALFLGIQEVRSLSFSTKMMVDVAHFHTEELPAFANLIRLELAAKDVNCWNKILEFLERSPRLEVLIIREAADEPFDDEPNFSPPEQVPQCLLSFLREIVIKEFRGYKELTGYEFGALGYILQNAHVLQVLNIQFQNFEQAEIHQIEDQLTGIQRASANCSLICNGRDL